MVERPWPTQAVDVSAIRVVLANRPRLLRHLLREIFDAEPDFEVVAEHAEVDPWRALERLQDVDFVLSGPLASSNEVEALRALGAKSRKLQVLIVSGNEQELWRLRPEGEAEVFSLGSLPEFVDLLRRLRGEQSE